MNAPQGRLRQFAGCLEDTSASPFARPRDERGRWVGEPTFEVIKNYWRDPSAFEADAQAGQQRINRLFAGHDARVRAEQEARWAREEGK